MLGGTAVSQLSGHGGSFIAVVVVLLGFALAFFSIHRETRPVVDAESVFKQFMTATQPEQLATLRAEYCAC
jgi:hypothetical protein